MAEEFLQKDVTWPHHNHSHEMENGENGECLFSVYFLHFIHLEDPSPGDVSPTVGKSSHFNLPSQENP